MWQSRYCTGQVSYRPVTQCTDLILNITVFIIIIWPNLIFTRINSGLRCERCVYLTDCRKAAACLAAVADPARRGPAEPHCSLLAVRPVWYIFAVTASQLVVSHRRGWGVEISTVPNVSTATLIFGAFRAQGTCSVDANVVFFRWLI